MFHRAPLERTLDRVAAEERRYTHLHSRFIGC